MELAEEIAKRMIMEAAESMAMHVEFPLKNGKVQATHNDYNSMPANATVMGDVCLLTLIHTRRPSDLYENMGLILNELKFTHILSDMKAIESNYILKIDSPHEMAEVFVICSQKGH